MRDARNDRARTLTSGSSSAPFNGTNAGTTICSSSSGSCRSLGQEPTPAARAALASRVPGLYEPLHWALLVADVPFDLDHIPGAARSVGLDAERLARDMETLALDALIARNAILANALSARGTPAFVIGDGMIRGALPLEQFSAAIADARVAPEGARNRSGAD